MYVTVSVHIAIASAATAEGAENYAATANAAVGDSTSPWADRLVEYDAIIFPVMPSSIDESF